VFVIFINIIIKKIPADQLFLVNIGSTINVLCILHGPPASLFEVAPQARSVCLIFTSLEYLEILVTFKAAWKTLGLDYNFNILAFGIISVMFLHSIIVYAYILIF